MRYAHAFRNVEAAIALRLLPAYAHDVPIFHRAFVHLFKDIFGILRERARKVAR